MDFDVLLPRTNKTPGRWPWADKLDTDGVRRILADIDELDYRSVLICEHLAMPYFEVPRLGPYWEDALSVAAFAAGATRRVRIDFAVLVLPYHHPLRLAKSLSTIDVLSDGRLDVSIGVGHAEQEFAALGVPFRERGAITDETLDAVETLWIQDRPEHLGKYFDISGLAFEPKPVQKPRPPIYVGGNSKPALRRAARYEGWQPNYTHFTIDEVPPLLDYLYSRPEMAGKEDSFAINWFTKPAGVDLPDGFAAASPTQLRAYRDQLLDAYSTTFRAARVTRTVAEPPAAIASEDEYRDYLRWFSAEVIPAAS